MWWSLVACVGPRALVEEEEERATFRLTEVAIVDRVDLDGDGVVDNHLYDVLTALEGVFPDQPFGPDEFAEVLLDNVTNYSVVDLEAHLEEDFHLHVTTGARAEDGRITTSGDVAMFEGTYGDDGGFEAGPADLALDLVVRADLPPQPLDLVATTLSGGITSDHRTMRGTIVSHLPVERIVASFVEPALPPGGYDLDGDGRNESLAELLDLIREVAPSFADQDLDGEPVITAALSFAATYTEEADPGE